MCASWLARYGAKPKAMPAQIPANVDPVSRRPRRNAKNPESAKVSRKQTL